MIRRPSLNILLPLCLLPALLLADGHAERKPLTLAAIFSDPAFSSVRLRDVQWHSGTEFTYSRLVDGMLTLFKHDLSKGRSKALFEPGSFATEQGPVKPSAYEWGHDQRFLVITGPRVRTWESIIEAPCFIYDSRSKKTWAVANGKPLRNVKLSPSGRHLGYVIANNLYVMDLESQQVRAVTSDGSNHIFNGIFDYGSTEFGFTDAWHWSPDGSKLAFWRLDATEVKTFWIINELGNYSEVFPLKYPNTAQKHAVNQIGVYDLKQGTTLWVKTNHDPDDYLPRIDWTRSSKTLAIQHLTRDHDDLALLFADTTTGETTVVLTDTDPAWIDITRDLTFLSTEDTFVWTSEKSGYRHAYRYDYEGKETQLTQGDWEISSLIAVDEDNRWLFFYAKKDSFIDQHVYRVSLDGGPVTKLTDKPGWYEWQFSADRQHVIQTYSTAEAPPVITLGKPDDAAATLLVDNGPALQSQFHYPDPEFFQFQTSDDVKLNAYMIKPPAFDPAKPYPVIAYGYGNAGSQMVVNRWGSSRGVQRDMWHRYMAQQGYLVFCMDNRTTAGRGKLAKNMTYGHYAKWAVSDQLEGVKFLKAQSYVDSDRLGFWGWSGGGYLAAALMTKGAPAYKTGVSVAPVIDLRRYQAVGVERWMDQLEVNPEGYYQTNLLNFADQLEGDLLLIHGTGDENVKFAFTLQFADALIKAGKQFDMMVYPSEHHGIEGARQHVYTKIANYFLDKL